MILYGDTNSGNCLKVKWTADRLGIAYTWVPIDIMNGDSRTPAYLAKFPQGQVPAVEWPATANGEGRTLAQSNAIIRYLARGSRLLPEAGYAQAKIDEWLFWEQYSHEPYVATTRYQVVYLKRSMAEREAWRVERAEQALDFLNGQLAGRAFLIDQTFSIADIALLAYTRLAPEGGYDFTSRPQLRRWIAACEAELDLAPLNQAQ